MAKDIESEARNIINEIVEKAADGNYIYRGEPKCYTEVSSGLWRQLQSTFTPHDRLTFDYDALQELHLREARRYGGNLSLGDFELASHLQHLGGKTNLIDFTTDYLVALFYACDGVHDHPGRVILFKLTEDKRRKYKIEPPQNPINRIVAQKSVFVRHQKGVIEEGDIEKICIHRSFKKPILTYLRKYHGIYTQTIYNDLQGYIKHQKIHYKAYSEYGRGQLSHFNNPGRIVSVNDNPYDDSAPAYTAIEHYGRAIELYPDFIEACYARAGIYLWIDNFDKAIKDFTRVIELDPDYASAYTRRGAAYSKKGCRARAIEDFNRAIELGDNSARVLLEEEQKKGAPE